MSHKRIWSVAMGACLIALALPRPAPADSLQIKVTATYWVLAENDQDTGGSKCCSTVTDMVLNQLGSDGLPLVNPKYVSSGYIKDVNGSGEITWWSPNFNSDVSFLGTESLTLPFQSFEYPPSGNDFSGFLVAEFQGNFMLTSAAKVMFTTVSDDDSLIYIDGKLLLDNGGVKNRDKVSGTVSLGAGVHSLALFYADRDPSGAWLNVSDSVHPTPEPATLSLLGIGLLGIAAVIKRRASGPIAKTLIALICLSPFAIRASARPPSKKQPSISFVNQHKLPMTSSTTYVAADVPDIQTTQHARRGRPHAPEIQKKRPSFSEDL